MGAWIETVTAPESSSLSKVAPRMGAWIETPGGSARYARWLIVAPRMGAWIETKANG